MDSYEPQTINYLKHETLKLIISKHNETSTLITLITPITYSESVAQACQVCQRFFVGFQTFTVVLKLPTYHVAIKWKISL